MIWYNINCYGLNLYLLNDYNLNSRILRSLTVMSVECYCKFTPAWLTCLKMIRNETLDILKSI